LKLADEGLLRPFEPRELAEFGGAWPAGLSSPGKLWYGFGLRARAIVYNTARVEESEAPKASWELTDPKWKGRIGMARPQFGTTRGQMAYICAVCGESTFRTWLAGLKANGLRLYDGNSAVVRAVSQGEIDAGLTDTDDVTAGQAQKWPVGLVLEATGGGPCTIKALLMPIPNTVALVKGSPHPEAGQKLAEFLLSDEAERMLAKSESRNLPIREKVAQEFAGSLPISAFTPVDWAAIHKAEAAAMKACDEVLGQ
jgi:iron(III) transport system substrate-binding protein